MSEALTSDILSLHKALYPAGQSIARWSQGLLGHRDNFNLLHSLWESLIIVDHAVLERFG
jgi:hypothetical protein